MVSIKHIKTLKTFAWFILLLLGIALFVFALISGSEEGGILQNSPNALPWLILILLALFARENPILGGIIVLALGLVTVYFFNFSGPNFFLVTFIVTLIIPVLGFLLVLCGYRIRKAQKPG